MSDSSKKVLLKALSYLRPYLRFEILALILALIGIALEAINPWISKILIDDVCIARNIEKLGLVALLLFLTLPFELLVFFSKEYLFAWIGEHVDVDLKSDLFSHIQSKPISYFDEQDPGSLMAYFTSDIAAMRELYRSSLVSFCCSILSVIIFIAIMFRTDPTLTLISFPIYPIYVLASRKLGKKLQGVSEHVQEYNSLVSTELNEQFSGIRDIKAFTRESLSLERIKERFDQLLKERLVLTRIDLRARSANFVIYLGYSAVVLIGAYRAYSGSISAGSLMAYLAYFGMVFYPAYNLVDLYTSIRKVLGAAGRVFRVMEEPGTLPDIDEGISSDTLRGDIDFEGVTFKYPSKDEPALIGIDLHIKAGERIALVGPSGAGKTTLVSLLSRFYEPSEGRILLDGIDLNRYSINCVRGNVGLMMQSFMLFNTTIRDNLLFARPDASEELIHDAARAARIHDFICSLPEGYDTETGDKAVRLSGGQRQRIAIARLMLYNPRIVILDEATSSLDSEVEADIQEAMNNLFSGRTSIVIAHRLATVRNCDRIVVLDQGRIVAQGNHEDLCRADGLYTRLNDLQRF